MRTHCIESNTALDSRAQGQDGNIGINTSVNRLLFEIQNDEYWNGKSSKVNPEIIGDVPLLHDDDSGNEQTTDNTSTHPRPATELGGVASQLFHFIPTDRCFTLSCQL